ncbi:hypothetical protein [Chryseobacterium aquaticum]|uniref:Bacteriocin n=1 Tax=Chryseobacterium aquaticum subsp. greenlandense TaxID=345663 RepID=A0A101CJQ4_9FLAO|nr:hypothetical protein [Chryseobacterium aquaticum]KUJ57219.1 hypothetical protein AR686_06085 [Chryseobacterium aquaticum subsp. greenlandense]
MKKIKKFKENLSRNEMRKISGGDKQSFVLSQSNDLGESIDGGEGTGYCGGVCGRGIGCSSSGLGDCSCTASNALEIGFCQRHG